MSINLLDMLKDQVSGQLASQASSFLGESEDNVTSALGGAFPAILGSVIDKSSSPEGAGGLMDMIGSLDLDMLGNIGGLFGGGASSVNGLLNSGGGIMDMLLGDKMGGIVEMISKISGLKSGSTNSLLKMAAPFLMGIIGKQIKGKGLSFLTDMLMGQKDHVAAALPSGMGDLLGLGFAAKSGDALKGVANAATGTISGAADMTKDATSNAATMAAGAAKMASNTAENVADTAENAASTGMGWVKWALPLLLVGGAAWYFLGGKGEDALTGARDAATSVVGKTKDVAGGAVDATKDMVKATGNAVANMASAAFEKVDEAAKTALGSIQFAANSAGSQMMEFIDGGFKGDGKVTFKNLTFATGSDKIDGKSGVEVDNLAAILKAYPGVSINVSGYTDNQGNADNNKTLSEDRAKSVKARLVGQGIAGTRIKTAGYGADNPVASNDSAEGRAQNRRIEVTIAQ